MLFPFLDARAGTIIEVAATRRGPRSCTLRLVDPELGLEARRLYLSAALAMHVTRSVKGRVAVNSDTGDLLALARDLNAERIERAHSLSFEPPYPGVTAGVKTTSGGLRLLLACHVSERDGKPIGVAFTSLIPGRPPQVSVAPPGTPISEEWRSPEEGPA